MRMSDTQKKFLEPSRHNAKLKRSLESIPSGTQDSSSDERKFNQKIEQNKLQVEYKLAQAEESSSSDLSSLDDDEEYEQLYIPSPTNESHIPDLNSSSAISAEALL
eukprot:TRINITY_DN4112_c0_g1_i2.p1 TRINITY_DN4112_c0_g1~~TRINITY_DN4112_c0_g1_i2.p1  ORF type:complete len:106 (-),score=26.79 TRINITY_DN4112_c0_g1_i2:1106-1423(-)